MPPRRSDASGLSDLGDEYRTLCVSDVRTAAESAKADADSCRLVWQGGGAAHRAAVIGLGVRTLGTEGRGSGAHGHPIVAAPGKGRSDKTLELTNCQR